MKFTKMHGIGNDYVYVNCFEEKIEEPGRIAQLVSNRHFGIGSDGLILIKPSDIADFCMEMYNADGSMGAMCGNGIRCVGKYVYDHGLTNMTTITIETSSGVKTLDLTVVNGQVAMATVDMGSPILTSHNVDKVLFAEDYMNPNQEKVHETISVEGRDYQMISISMGNPHAIVFVEDTEKIDIEKIGPLFEKHERFPDRTNTEFIQVIDNKNLKMRVWERGAGETLACGTGACASLVAASLAGYVNQEAFIKLLGGTLQIHIRKKDGHVIMTGPATEVFTGEILI